MFVSPFVHSVPASYLPICSFSSRLSVYFHLSAVCFSLFVFINQFCLATSPRSRIIYISSFYLSRSINFFSNSTFSLSSTGRIKNEKNPPSLIFSLHTPHTASLSRPHKSTPFPHSALLNQHTLPVSPPPFTPCPSVLHPSHPVRQSLNPSHPAHQAEFNHSLTSGSGR